MLRRVRAVEPLCGLDDRREQSRIARGVEKQRVGQHELHRSAQGVARRQRLVPTEMGIGVVPAAAGDRLDRLQRNAFGMAMRREAIDVGHVLGCSVMACDHGNSTDANGASARLRRCIFGMRRPWPVTPT